ncbi:MAG: hypothetical protein AAF553_06435 [Pseudomonadota bacterium]
MIIMVMPVTFVIMVVVVVVSVMVWNAVAIMVVIVIFGLAGLVVLGVDEAAVVRLASTRGQSHNRQRNPHCTHLVSP